MAVFLGPSGPKDHLPLSRGHVPADPDATIVTAFPSLLTRRQTDCIWSSISSEDLFKPSKQQMDTPRIAPSPSYVCSPVQCIAVQSHVDGMILAYLMIPGFGGVLMSLPCSEGHQRHTTYRYARVCVKVRWSTCSQLSAHSTTQGHSILVGTTPSRTSRCTGRELTGTPLITLGYLALVLTHQMMAFSALVHCT